MRRSCPPATSGEVAVYRLQHDTDLLIDINGYFAAPGTGGSLVLSSCALPRLRQPQQQRPAVHRRADGEHRRQPVRAAQPAPQAMCSTRPWCRVRRLGYLTLWADGQTQPVVSTLNAYDGFVTSNMAIVPNMNGSTDAYADGTTQLILDISGYFAP